MTKHAYNTNCYFGLLTVKDHKQPIPFFIEHYGKAYFDTLGILTLGKLTVIYFRVHDKE